MTVVTADKTALLRKIQLFSELDSLALERIASRCVATERTTGTVLFTAGEPCRGLYIVVSGRVRVFRVSPDGREQVLHLEGPGRPVAELPLLDGGDYPASAVAVEDSRLLFLPRTEFEALYRSNPDVAHAIIRALGKRLRHLVQLTQTLAFRDVAARLALLLAGDADREGESTPQGVLLVLNRTREEIALEIGTARESVSRAFKQLAQRGMIEQLARGRIRIPSLERLRSLAAPGERPRG